MKLVFKYTLEMIPPLPISQGHDNLNMITYGKMLCKLFSSTGIRYSHDYGNYVITSNIKC